MSRILCWTTRRNAEILQLESELRAMGHEIRKFFADDYYQCCSYFWKKMDEWGWGQRKRAYLRRKREIFAADLKKFVPEVILFINYSPQIISWEELHELARHYELRFWYVDGIAGWREAAELRPYHLAVYDRESVEYLHTLGVEGAYCPVGYGGIYWKTEQKKEMDVTFIGSPYHNRLKLLEELAARGKAKGWKLRICGPFYEERYFWKKYLFALRYPFLSQILENCSMAPAMAAELYARSRICLNIHDARNKGLNPRTFEVMAAGAMQLLDERGDYDIIEPGKHVASFRDGKELLEKVEYYLSHEAEREQIARQGQNHVKERRSMRRSLEIALGMD